MRQVGYTHTHVRTRYHTHPTLHTARRTQLVGIWFTRLVPVGLQVTVQFTTTAGYTSSHLRFCSLPRDTYGSTHSCAGSRFTRTLRTQLVPGCGYTHRILHPVYLDYAVGRYGYTQLGCRLLRYSYALPHTAHVCCVWFTRTHYTHGLRLRTRAPDFGFIAGCGHTALPHHWFCGLRAVPHTHTRILVLGLELPVRRLITRYAFAFPVTDYTPPTHFPARTGCRTLRARLHGYAVTRLRSGRYYVTRLDSILVARLRTAHGCTRCRITVTFTGLRYVAPRAHVYAHCVVYGYVYMTLPRYVKFITPVCDAVGWLRLDTDFYTHTARTHRAVTTLVALRAQRCPHTVARVATVYAQFAVSWRVYPLRCLWFWIGY